MLDEGTILITARQTQNGYEVDLTSRMPDDAVWRVIAHVFHGGPRHIPLQRGSDDE